MLIPPKAKPVFDRARRNHRNAHSRFDPENAPDVAENLPNTDGAPRGWPDWGPWQGDGKWAIDVAVTQAG